ncbi:MAG: AbiV family abortive infection protein [Thermoanaerobaculia bacterium]
MSELTDVQLAALEGTERACEGNARAYLNEARILLGRKGYVRAFFLALTGLEEAAKTQLIADCRGGQISLHRLRRAFKDHNHRFAYLKRSLSEAASPAGSLPPLEINYEPSDGKPFSALREASLYVGLSDSLSPEAPWDTITEEEARRAVAALHQELQAMKVASLVPGGATTKNVYFALRIKP